MIKRKKMKDYKVHIYNKLSNLPNQIRYRKGLIPFLYLNHIIKCYEKQKMES